MSIIVHWKQKDFTNQIYQNFPKSSQSVCVIDAVHLNKILMLSFHKLGCSSSMKNEQKVT